MFEKLAVVTKADDKYLNKIGLIEEQEKGLGLYVRFDDGSFSWYFENEISYLDNTVSSDTVERFRELLEILENKNDTKDSNITSLQKTAIDELAEMLNNKPRTFDILLTHHSLTLEEFNCISHKTKEKIIYNSLTIEEIDSFGKLIDTLQQQKKRGQSKLAAKKSLALNELTKIFNENSLKFTVLLSLFSLDLVWYKDLLPSENKGSLKYTVSKLDTDSRPYYKITEMDFCCKEFEDSYAKELNETSFKTFDINLNEGTLTVEDIISTSNETVQKTSKAIKFCPFCGSRAERIVIY